jgi:regulator of CtrA degradation
MEKGVRHLSKVSKGLLTMSDKTGPSAMTVEFISRFASSEQFNKVFKEGMGLVEETANYLDGPGRSDSRLLDRLGAIAYATESMRLTTRLMQLASWLLLQRAVVSGEVSPEEAHKEKNRINLTEIGSGVEIENNRDPLPEGLGELITRSLRLLERIRMLDSMMQKRANLTDVAPVESPVSTQLSQLQRAFGSR